MLLQPITVPFSKSTLKPSVYTLKILCDQYLMNATTFEPCKFYLQT